VQTDGEGDRLREEHWNEDVTFDSAGLKAPGQWLPPLAIWKGAADQRLFTIRVATAKVRSTALTTLQLNIWLVETMPIEFLSGFC
jgi:hypothetical protein